MRFDSWFLLLVDEFAVGLGEMAVVLGAHGLLFVIDGCFLLLDVSGLAGGKLAALDSLGDAVLLVFLTLVDGGVALREDRGGGEGKSECQRDVCKFHDVLLGVLYFR